MSEAELDDVPCQTARDLDAGAHRTMSEPVDEVLANADRVSGARTGVLIGITDNGCTPLVIFAGQPGTAALAGRSTIDLHEAHIGKEVVLLFEEGDPALPIIVGCLRTKDARWKTDSPGQVDVDVDGERLLVTAKEQLVLRCGKASITLTKAGKVVIEGAYLSSRSTGVIRIKGGSVQLN